MSTSKETNLWSFASDIIFFICNITKFWQLLGRKVSLCHKQAFPRLQLCGEWEDSHRDKISELLKPNTWCLGQETVLKQKTQFIFSANTKIRDYSTLSSGRRSSSNSIGNSNNSSHQFATLSMMNGREKVVNMKRSKPEFWSFIWSQQHLQMK